MGLQCSLLGLTSCLSGDTGVGEEAAVLSSELAAGVVDCNSHILKFVLELSEDSLRSRCWVSLGSVDLSRRLAESLLSLLILNCHKVLLIHPILVIDIVLEVMGTHMVMGGVPRE